MPDTGKDRRKTGDRMFTTNMTEEKLLENFSRMVFCSQAVFAEFAPQLGIDRETALKIAAPFASGMYDGATCGAVAGALMVLGLKYGQGDSVDPEKMELMLAKVGKFKAKILEKYGSCICKELIGYKMPEEVELVQAEGKFESVCSKIVTDACAICAELLNED